MKIGQQISLTDNYVLAELQRVSRHGKNSARLEVEFVAGDVDFAGIADVLAFVVGDLDALLPGILGGHPAAAELHHDIGCLVAGDTRIAGDIGADAGADLDAATEMVHDSLVTREIQGIGEDQQLGARVDSELLQTRDDHLADFDIVARINPITLQQKRLLAGEGTEERTGAEEVRQRGSERALIDLHPVFQHQVIRTLVAEEGGVGLDILVGEGADRNHVVLHGEEHIGGAGAIVGTALLEPGHDGVVRSGAVAAAGAEF